MKTKKCHICGKSLADIKDNDFENTVVFCDECTDNSYFDSHDADDYIDSFLFDSE